MDIVKNRLDNYFASNSNPMTLVMTHIVSIPDEFVLQLYSGALHMGYSYSVDLLPLADIYSAGYMALRSIYSHKSLLNQPYIQSKATTPFLMGEDVNLLASMTIAIEVNNELLRFISSRFPQKVDRLQEIIERTIHIGSLDPFGKTPLENFNSIQSDILSNFQFILDWIVS